MTQNVVAFAPALKTRLLWRAADFESITTQALLALANAGANLYNHGGLLVQLISGDQGTVHIAPIKRPRLREIFQTHIDWRVGTMSPDGQRSTKRIPAPTLVAETALAREDWPELRELHGVVDSPVVRPDGTLLVTPGYDEATKLFYTKGFDLPSMPVSPTLDEARVALAELLDMTCDFPFDRPADKSACLAAMLTPFVRYAFKGPSPLALFDASTRGSGKTLLAKAMGMIPLGYEMSCMPPADDDREERKRITSIAIRGDRAVLIDNVATQLGTPSLDSALTSTRWQDRLLGGNSTFDGELLTCWFATGNNVNLAGDTARRTLHIRLAAQEENPESRVSFKHTDLLKVIRARRPQLVAAALTLIRGWYVAGAPAQDVRTWGSFEGWTALVPQILVWAGLEDPSLTRVELVNEAEGDRDTLRDLLVAMQVYDPNGLGSTARQVAEDLVNDPDGTQELKAALCERIRTRGGQLPSVNQIGVLFRSVRQRVVGDLRLESMGRNENGMKWRVGKVGIL